MVLTQALIDKLAAWQAAAQGNWYYLGFGSEGEFLSARMQGVPKEGLEIETLWIGNGSCRMGIQLEEAEYFGDYRLLLRAEAGVA